MFLLRGTDGEREFWSSLYLGQLKEKDKFGPVCIREEQLFILGETDVVREFWSCLVETDGERMVLVLFILGETDEEREIWSCLYGGN